MTPDKYEINHKIIEALKANSYEVLHRFDHDTESAVRVNTQLLMRILDDSKATEYGTKYGFTEIHDTDTYKKRVPLTDHSDYADYISRMMDGESNILTTYPIVYYAQTSGTSGKPKNIPVSDRGLEVFRNYFSSLYLSVMSDFYKTTRLKDIPDGLSFLTVSVAQHTLPTGTKYGCISAACLKDEIIPLLPFLVTTPYEALSSSESADMKYIHSLFGLRERSVHLLTGSYIPFMLDIICFIRDKWQLLVSDIRTGTISKEVSIPESLREKLSAKISPDPERADELEREFSKGFDSTIMKRIWPNLSGIATIWAGNFSSYARRLQGFSGRSIPYYTMSYAASEGVYGAARHPYDQCYVLIPESCFYEFIPVDDSKDDNTSTVLIDGVQEGRDYELVITNQSGLYRYRTGDIIQVTGFYNESPMVAVKYRKNALINAIAGEKFTENDLAMAVLNFERRTGIDAVDFCMYSDRSTTPGRYVIFIEPEEKADPSRMDEYTAIMDRELIRANENYEHFVSNKNNRLIGVPKIVFLQPQTFQLHREIRMYKMGISENQIKTVRFLNTPELIEFFTGLEDK